MLTNFLLGVKKVLYLKIFVFYLATVLILFPAIAFIFKANETKEEQSSKPKFPKRTYRTMFIFGIVTLLIGFGLFLI